VSSGGQGKGDKGVSGVAGEQLQESSDGALSESESDPLQPAVSSSGVEAVALVFERLGELNAERSGASWMRS
jgi:hypothetical protein